MKAFQSLVILGFLAALVSSQTFDAAINSAQELLRTGAYSQAITKFKQIVAADPGNFEAQYNMAYAYLVWEHYADALREFKKAAGIRPRNADTWVNMGFCYEKLGEDENTIACFTKAVQYNPDNLEARTNLAAMYANRKQYNAAITQLKEVLSMDGSNQAALTNISQLYIITKDYGNAKMYLKEAIAANPSNAGQAYYELGNIAFKYEKNIDEAIVNYQKAVQVESSSEVFYDDLGRAQEAKGDNSAAVATYKKYLSVLMDPLKKEEIEGRIDRIENPEKYNDKMAIESAGTQKSTMKKMERDDAPAPSSGSEDRVNVGSVDVLSDLENLSSDTAESFNFRDAAKKRSQQKKNSN